jgi:GR25 family glycosyltransferase involved in LPS biosynthesis
MLRRFSDIKHAIYINLDSRTDRRALFESQIDELHTRYPADFSFFPVSRFSAIKHEHGAIGCSKSHIECLRIAKNNGWDHVLIFEDDAHLIHPEILVHQVSSFLSRFHDNWDVLLLSGNNFPPFKIEAPDCFRVANCQVATCYLVCSRYYDTLLENFENSLAGLEANPENKPEFACDMYWKRLQRTDRWYLITPICVTQRPGYSDIEKQVVDYEKAMTDLVKKRPPPSQRK